MSWYASSATSKVTMPDTFSPGLRICAVNDAGLAVSAAVAPSVPSPYRRQSNGLINIASGPVSRKASVIVTSLCSGAGLCVGLPEQSNATPVTVKDPDGRLIGVPMGTMPWFDCDGTAITTGML